MKKVSIRVPLCYINTFLTTATFFYLKIFPCRLECVKGKEEISFGATLRPNLRTSMSAQLY